jgi:hypothetical protein
MKNEVKCAMGMIQSNTENGCFLCDESYLKHKCGSGMQCIFETCCSCVTRRQILCIEAATTEPSHIDHRDLLPRGTMPPCCCAAPPPPTDGATASDAASQKQGKRASSRRKPKFCWLALQEPVAFREGSSEVRSSESTSDSSERSFCPWG